MFFSEACIRNGLHLSFLVGSALLLAIGVAADMSNLKWVGPNICKKASNVILSDPLVWHLLDLSSVALHHCYL